MKSTIYIDILDFYKLKWTGISSFITQDMKNIAFMVRMNIAKTVESMIE